MVRFSVVTVALNAEKVIRTTIDSVLNQNCSPFQYIIIDGNSSDGTMNIVESYRDAFLKKKIDYIVVSEKDLGIYNAMNKGIQCANGDFISFLNAGDWYEPDALKIVNDLYDINPFDMAYGGLHYINPNGTITNKMSKDDTHGIVTSRHWNHPSMFLNTKYYKEYGFNEKFYTYADFDLYLKMRKVGVKICIINKIITNFVANGVSTSTNLKKAFGRAKEKYQAYRENGYSTLYWIEAYGWELFKAIYFSIRS